MLFNFMETKSNEPRKTQKRKYNQFEFSDSTKKRYRDDIKMDSHYQTFKYRKKIKKPRTLITQSQSQTTNEKPKKIKILKLKKERPKRCFFRKQSLRR